MAMTFTTQTLGPIVKVTGAWTSDALGDAAGTTNSVVHGEIIKGVTIPGAAAPSSNYDIAITDGNSVNVLTACQDNLADRHATNTEEEYFLVLDDAGTALAQSIHPVVADRLTVTVSNAGNTKAGTVILYIRGSLHGTE